MKTTNEGFLVNTLRRIPRHGVKALAAGALLIAAALPLAVASSAGAATAPTLTSVSAFASAAGTGAQTAGDSFGAGGSGTLVFTGSGFAHDGGNVTLTTNATGVTFSGATEGTSATSGTAHFSSTTSVAPGTYSVTLTDDNGTSNTVANAFTVFADPAIAATSPIVPATLSDGNGATSVTVSGSGFENAADAGATDSSTVPSVSITSTVNGTSLYTGTVTATATSLTFNVTPVKAVNGVATTNAATPGTYTLTVLNQDGGYVTTGPIFTITAYGITNVSPSALPVNTPASVTDSYVTVNGSGFEYGAGVTIAAVTGSAPGPSTPTGLSVVAATVTSATTVSVELAQTPSEATATSQGLYSVTVANPSTGLGGNGATYSLGSAIGVGEASTVAPTVTAATTAAALVAGGVPSTMTITGTGFSQYSTVALYPGTSTVQSTTVTAPYVAGNTGTTLSASVTAAGGATAGPYSITVSGSSEFAAAATVAGPVITSQTPLTVNAPAGTVVTLTGTGFENIDQGTFNQVGAGDLQGIISYVNATTLDFVVTQAPQTADITPSGTTTPSVYVTQTVNSVSTVSPTFKIVVSASPVVNAAVTYATAPINDVGVGATAEVVTIHGTGFATGVTLTKFTNGGGVADPDVTATVTGVNTAGTAITATIAVATGDLNIADGYTVTNTNGGTTTVSAISYPVVIGPGPTITSVTPATSPASATTAFTIVGTNFETGVAVAATADGTCGTTTVTNATTLTVSCTFGAATATAAALQVINPDGGTATSATIIPAATATSTGAPHATSESGSGIIGRTVHISVQGVGFYGQPSVSSTGNSVKAVVSGDTGTVLTIQITVGKTTGPGEHTLTFTLADGKVFKANYAIIK